jgi:hypothetical protein
MQDFAVNLNELTPDSIQKHLKEEMVQGFIGMPSKHQMLLLAIFY